MPQNKYPTLDTKKGQRQYQSCYITTEGVYVHMQHIISHREDSSDSIYQILNNETHINSDTKRILTACPVHNESFHVMRVIDRKSDGKELKYHNVLANTNMSRYITQTPAASSMSRTMDGYNIPKDIDTWVAEKWSVLIGKPTLTPAQTIDHILDEETLSEPRPDFRYPDSITPPQTKKRSREEDEEQNDSNKRSKAV